MFGTELKHETTIHNLYQPTEYKLQPNGINEGIKMAENGVYGRYLDSVIEQDFCSVDFADSGMKPSGHPWVKGQANYNLIFNGDTVSNYTKDWGIFPGDLKTTPRQEVDLSRADLQTKLDSMEAGKSTECDFAAFMKSHHI